MWDEVYGVDAGKGGVPKSLVKMEPFSLCR